MKLPDLKAIRQAHERIAPYIHRTPVLTSSYLNRITEAELFFKCENFQKVGAFKFRGAMNAVSQLSKVDGDKGIITHSSGNHAQAVALAAKLHGYKATIVMPENAPKVKVSAVKGYGAAVVFCEPTIEAREETAAEIMDATGATFIHPYNHPHVIAGQGTAALELMDQAEDLDEILAPVGGGGLISGTAIVAKSLSPSIRVTGGEPELADDAFRSLKSGKIEPVLRTDTVADGLRTSLGGLTFEVIRNHVDRIITVPEKAIVRDMRIVWERMKIIIEPSSAVPLSVIMENKEMFRGKRIGLILTGGNVDLEQLPWP